MNSRRKSVGFQRRTFTFCDRVFQTTPKTEMRKADGKLENCKKLSSKPSHVVDSHLFIDMSVIAHFF